MLRRQLLFERVECHDDVGGALRLLGPEAAITSAMYFGAAVAHRAEQAEMCETQACERDVRFDLQIHLVPRIATGQN